MSPTITLAERVSRISVSSTMKVSAEADRLKSEGVDVVVFGAGEPDFPTPDNIKQAAIRAIDNNFTKYTAAAGTMELRKAVCERHRQDFGTDYKPAECVIDCGGKHSLFNIAQVLLQPGDEVLIPVPFWVSYQDIVNYSDGRCVFVESEEENNFQITAKLLEAAITDRTRVMIINSPSNPSGAVLSKQEFREIYDLARARGIYLITDECYCQFLYDGDPFSAAAFPGAKDTVIVSGSLSKTYAMTGWRIGFTLAPEPIVSAIVKLQSHSISNPTSIAQKAAVEALTGPQDSVGEMLAEYRRRRDYVLPRLRQIPGVSCAEPRGAFYVYPNISVALGKNGINSTLDFCDRLLKEAHVAAVPGEAFGTNQHIRISYATSMEELKRGLGRIDRFIQANS